jgi:hypothetical protein
MTPPHAAAGRTRFALVVVGTVALLAAFGSSPAPGLGSAGTPSRVQAGPADASRPFT